MKKVLNLISGKSLLFFAMLLLFGCNKDAPVIDTGGGGGGGSTPTTPGLQYPSKEMRAVWVTTAWGLDWPLGDYNETSQKQKYIQYLEKCQELKINTIFFQVRAMGDAYYESAYEPWATSITGTRGNNPGYDVLKFMIDEAHARGIEFHAWMNPYRIATRANNSTPYPALHSSINSAWVTSHEKIQIYNPARPEVRQRIVDIIKELLNKYNVDGIHLDDYFYPDPSSAGVMVSDQSDYEAYGAGFPNIADWRRSNVNKAIEDIHAAIVATKPQVVFSISPAASRNYNLNTLYADVVKWCQEGWVDLLIPQLYQEIGNPNNDFQANLGTWTQFSYDAAVVIGHALYRFGDPVAPSAFQSVAELERQINMAKRNNKVVGSAMYSARYLIDNRIGITNKLADLYREPAVMPFLGREIAPAPATPTNVRIEGDQLLWSTSGGVKSVVYYFPTSSVGGSRQGKVLAVTGGNSIAITQNGGYTVSTLNVDHKESAHSEIVEKR